MDLLKRNLAPEDKSEHISDEEALSLSLQKPDVFSVLVDRYQKPFIRKALLILYNKEEVEDAVQDVFVKIYSAGVKFKKVSGASFSSWAYKILINHCFNLNRKNARRYPVASSINDDWEDFTPDRNEEISCNRMLDRDEVFSVLSKMPETMGACIEKLSARIPITQIAQMFGISEGATRVRIHRAKRIFKEIWISYHE